MKSDTPARESERDAPLRAPLFRETPGRSGADRFDHRIDHAKQMGHTMKTTIIRAVAALSLAAAVLMAPTAANAYTDPAAVTISPSVATAGGVSTFTTAQSVFRGNEDVVISVTGAAANSITLASVATETNNSLRSKAVNGALNTPVRFPSTAKGTYSFTFTGAQSGVVLHASVTIAGSPSTPAKGGLAVTGFDASSTIGLWLAGGALLAGGAAVGIGSVVRRRRAAQS